MIEQGNNIKKSKRAKKDYSHLLQNCCSHKTFILKLTSSSFCSSSESNMTQVVAVLGAQWGDEGKGKIVDILSGEYEVSCVSCRSNTSHLILENTCIL